MNREEKHFFEQEIKQDKHQELKLIPFALIALGVVAVLIDVRIIFFSN